MTSIKNKILTEINKDVYYNIIKNYSLYKNNFIN